MNRHPKNLAIERIQRTEDRGQIRETGDGKRETVFTIYRLPSTFCFLRSKLYALCTICYLLFAICYPRAPLYAEENKFAAAFVSEVKGECLVLRGDGTQSRIKFGMFIYEGEVVKTGRRSHVRLVFSNGVETTIRQNSEISIMPIPPAERGISSKVKMVVGGIFSRVIRQRTKFDVHTPVATIAVRGTRFDTKVARGGATEVRVFRGTVEVKNEHGRREVKENMKTNISAGAAPSIPETLTEEEKKAVEETGNILNLDIPQRELTTGEVVTASVYVKGDDGSDDRNFKEKVTVNSSGDLMFSPQGRNRWAKSVRGVFKDGRFAFDIKGASPGEVGVAVSAENAQGDYISVEVAAPEEKTLKLDLKGDRIERELELKFRPKQ